MWGADKSLIDLVGVITLLLPGFVASWVFHGLTAHRIPTQFERIIQALIFTTFVQALVSLVRVTFLGMSNFFVVGTWTDDSSRIAALVLALLVGVAFAFLANRDWFSLLRNWGVTSNTSYPSEWFSAMATHPNSYFVFHLPGNRRLYGYPEEWPDHPDTGHFSVGDAEWLPSKTGEEGVKLPDVKRILVPAKDVEFIEIMKVRKKGEQNGPQGENPSSLGTRRR